MSVNAVTSASTEIYSMYDAGKKDSKKEVNENASKVEEGVVYEKSSDSEESKKATYSINKMSAEDRANLVQKLKEEQAAMEQNLIDIVNKTISGQANTFSIANSDDENSIWKFLASGNFTVDAATKAQAQQDISEDGYWGVKQTSQRLFDFASALAGDDVDKMKEMQEAMMKGYEQAGAAWGKDLPDISSKTIEAANKLFEDYYASKQSVTE